VSTVGPWTDLVAPNLVGAWRKILRPSKGVHLTFHRKRLELNQAVVMASDDEKRIVFGIPRHEMIIVGTTDTDYAGDPADVQASAEDVKYLLKVAGEYFPGAKLTADDIISSYVGVRPLVDDGAATESKTSREHLILTDPRNVTFVAGGKYTTYRRMAEQSVVAALEVFPIEDQVRFGRSDTLCALNPLATLHTIADSHRLQKHWALEFGLAEKEIELLISRHGAEALVMLENFKLDGRHVAASSEEKFWTIEARQAIRQTMCMNLTDFYFRRSPLFLSRADHGLIHIAHLGRTFAEELGWSDSERQKQAAQLQAHIRNELAWKQNFGISSSSF
jgi:glycerol-3-phosphate dehydrogenase